MTSRVIWVGATGIGILVWGLRCLSGLCVAVVLVDMLGIMNCGSGRLIFVRLGESG